MGEPQENQALSPEEELQTTGINDAVERLLAHPEWISMVASAIGFSPAEEGKKESTAEPTETADLAEKTDPPVSSPIPEALSAFAPLLSSLSKKDGKPLSKEQDQRACLLRALKPFVSDGRKDAIEKILRFSQVAELIKYLNL